MERPYEYRLTWDWSRGGLTLGYEGYRTREDGTREHFLNNVFDGKDPQPVIKAEQAMYQVLKDQDNSGLVKKIVMILTGDQGKEKK